MAEIQNVRVENWSPPGKEWWDEVKSRPDEPLIEATFVLKLSHTEYHWLINWLEEQNQ